MYVSLSIAATVDISTEYSLNDHTRLPSLLTFYRCFLPLDNCRKTMTARRGGEKAWQSVGKTMLNTFAM